MIIFSLGFAVIMGAMYDYFSDQYLDEMKSEAFYLQTAIKNSTSETDKSASDVLYELNWPSSYRITVITRDGVVVYDNKEDISKMSSHSDREEFKEASESGEGYSNRYSATSATQTINYALLLESGEVLRVSGTHLTVISVSRSLLPWVIMVGLLAAVISLILSAAISKSIMDPLNSINLDDPDETKVYSEFTGLIRRLREKNDEIDLQMEHLKSEHEKQDKMRREFSANVSHELKTPLTSISGYAELIKDGIAKTADVKAFAASIYDEAKRLIILVGEIMKLSQFDERAVQVKNEPIDLYESCFAILSELKTKAEGLNVKCTLTGHRCIIVGADEVVDEIIYNLVDNAIKYNRPSGEVTVNVSEKQGKVILRVSDTGIGIPKEDLNRIFERFYRVNKSHSKEINGTGLGLSIVKHAAAYLNAQVKVESEPGKGTVMSVIFPSGK